MHTSLHTHPGTHIVTHRLSLHKNLRVWIEIGSRGKVKKLEIGTKGRRIGKSRAACHMRAAYGILWHLTHVSGSIWHLTHASDKRR